MRQQQHAPSHPFPAVVFLVSFLTYLCAAPHPGYDSGLVDSNCYRASTNKQLVLMSTRSCLSSFFLQPTALFTVAPPRCSACGLEA